MRDSFEVKKKMATTRVEIHLKYLFINAYRNYLPWYRLSNIKKSLNRYTGNDKHLNTLKPNLIFVPISDANFVIK